MTNRDALTHAETLQIRLMLTACKMRFSESTAEMIAKMGVKAVPVLIQWLENTRIKVIDPLTREERGWVFPEGVISSEERDATATAALVKMGPPAIPAIMKAVEGGATSPGITEALMKMGPSAVPQLRNALKSTNRNARLRAAEALGGIDDASAISALIETLKDDDPAMRFRAAQGLGEIAKKNKKYDWIGAVPGLVNVLKEKDAAMGEKARDALAAIGLQAVPALIDALKDNDVRVQSYAAEVLGEIGDVSAVPALVGALKVKHMFVLGNAFRALVKIARQHPEHDWNGAVSAITETLKDERANMRRSAALVLYEFGKITDIDLKAVKEALVGHIESVEKKGNAAEIGEAKRGASGNYLIICEGVSRLVAAKHSLAGDGVILEGTFKAPADGKKGMYRQARAVL